MAGQEEENAEALEMPVEAGSESGKTSRGWGPRLDEMVGRGVSSRDKWETGDIY